MCRHLLFVFALLLLLLCTGRSSSTSPLTPSASMSPLTAEDNEYDRSMARPGGGPSVGDDSQDGQAPVAPSVWTDVADRLSRSKDDRTKLLQLLDFTTPSSDVTISNDVADDVFDTTAQDQTLFANRKPKLWSDLITEGLEAAGAYQKRQFGHVLNGGYKLGKRNGNGEGGDERVVSMPSGVKTLETDWRAPGSVALVSLPNLSRREQQDADEIRKQKRWFGKVLGGGYVLGKREMFPPEELHDLSTGPYPESAAQEAGRVMPGEASPRDLSSFRMTSTKDGLLLPASYFQSPDFPPFVLPDRMSLMKAILERIKEHSFLSDTDYAFPVGPGYRPAISGEDQYNAGDRNPTRNFLNAVQEIYSLLEEAQTLLRHLPAPDNAGETPFQSAPDFLPVPNTNGESFDAYERLELPERQDDVSFLDEVRNGARRLVQAADTEDFSYKIPSFASPVPLVNQQLAGSAVDVNHFLSRHPRGVGEIPGKRHKIGKRWHADVQDNLSDRRKRWFFNVKFPRGYKLGKRTQDQDAGMDILLQNTVDQNQFSLIDTLREYLASLKATISKLQPKKRYIWRSPYGYRTKRHAQNSRGSAMLYAGNIFQGHSHDSLLAPNANLQGSEKNSTKYKELSLPKHDHVKDEATEQQADSSGLEDQSENGLRHRIRTVQPHVRQRRPQPLVDRRYEARDPRLIATLPGGAFLLPRFWHPIGLFMMRKRNKSSADLTPSLDDPEQIQTAHSLVSPTREPDPAVHKRFFWKVLGGYKLGKRQPRSLLSPTSEPDPAIHKRFFWKVLGGYKLGKRGGVSQEEEKTPTGTHLQEQVGREVMDSDPWRDNRVLVKPLGGYKLGKKQTFGDEANKPKSSFHKESFSSMSRFSSDENTWRPPSFIDGNVLFHPENLDESIQGKKQGHKEADRSGTSPLTGNRQRAKKAIWNFLGRYGYLIYWPKKPVSKTKLAYSEIKRDLTQNNSSSEMTKTRRKRSAKIDQGKNDDSSGKRNTNQLDWDTGLPKKVWSKLLSDSKAGEQTIPSANIAGTDDSNGREDSEKLSANSPVKDYSLEKHKAVTAVTDESKHSEKEPQDLKPVLGKILWREFSRDYKLENRRPNVSRPALGQAYPTKRSWQKMLILKYILGKYSLKKMLGWLQTRSKTDGADNVILPKRFWGRLIGGYRLAGKRQLPGLVRKTVLNDHPEQLNEKLENPERAWGKRLTRGYKLKKRTFTAVNELRSAYKANRNDGARGTNLKLTKANINDIGEEAALGQHKANMNDGGERAAPLQLWRRFKEAVQKLARQKTEVDRNGTIYADSSLNPSDMMFWKLLGDFLFGDRSEEQPRELIDFLDPGSGEVKDDSKDVDLVENGPRPPVNVVIVPSRHDGPKAPDTDNVTDIPLAESIK